MRFRTHAKVASSLGSNDGILDTWINDTLVITEHIHPLYPADGQFASFFWGYIMGWANAGFAQKTFTWIDDFKITEGIM